MYVHFSVLDIPPIPLEDTFIKDPLSSKLYLIYALRIYIATHDSIKLKDSDGLFDPLPVFPMNDQTRRVAAGIEKFLSEQISSGSLSEEKTESLQG